MHVSATIPSIPARRLPGRTYDRQFFLAVILLEVGAVALGFWPTYYGAGVFLAPLPSLIVHIHGAVFSLWMVLLLVQSGLISVRQIAWHRRLGVAGFLVACCMPVLAVLVAAGVAARLKGAPNSEPDLYSLIIPFTDAFDFAALTGCAYALRRNGPAHKRLIILATAGLSGAAFFRWHLAILFHNGQAAYAASYVFLLLLIVYDLWSTHRVHRATAWGGTFLVLMEQSTRIVGPSAPWHRVIHWVQTWSV